MSEILTNLTPEIRDAKALERSAGHKAPSTADVAQAPAVVRQTDLATEVPGGRQADFPVEGAGGAARRDHANHYGWRLQAGMEIRSYAETIAVRDVAADETLTLNPALATIWRITAAGSFELNVAAIPDSTVGGEPASRVLSLVLYVQRAAGAEIAWPAGTLFGSDVTDPVGSGDPADSLLTAPLSSRMDVFVLTLVPSVGWVGYVAAIGLGAV